MDYKKISLEEHEKYKWKISIKSKVPLKNKDDLSTYYSPWVAAPCLKIKENPADAYKYTWKNNSVAVISDWSAVLGLWNIWGLAWLPVMEGKAILFKNFGNVDAIPIVLNTQDPDEIIKTIENISDTFGGINLEDIKAPECFYIEEKLKEKLNIPVFHDDQHGTAIVVLAGIINAMKIKKEELQNQKIVINWAGAAAIAIGKLLHKAGAENIVFVDSKWVVSKNRDDLHKYKKQVAEYNKFDVKWTLKDAIKDADIFVGVSLANLLNTDDVKTMNKNPIIFALANPTPEIMPDDAKEGGALIVATWRSDFPNQVNNVLVFPGIFRWALDSGINKITDDHKIAAAYALADFIKEPSVDKILPSALEEWVAECVADAIKRI